MTRTCASERLAATLIATLVACGPGLDEPTPPPSGEAPLLGVLVLPEDPVVPKGATLQLTATGLYDDRESRDLTAAVSWLSSDDAVVSVSDALDQEGALTAIAAGHAQVWAELDALASVPITVTVIDSVVEVLTVEPSSATLAQDDTLSLAASARYTDGTLADATALVRWVTEDPDVASITDGVLRARAVGETSVSASLGDVDSPPVPVTVLGSSSPDLTVPFLTASGTTETLLVHATIENRGAVGASDFRLDVFVDPPSAPRAGDRGDAFERLSYVGPDARSEVSFTLDGLSAGSHEIWVVVDTDDDIEEANEADNAASTDLEVTDDTLPPNLATDLVLYLTDDIHIYYWVEVTNYGDEPAPPFFVDVWVDRLDAPEVGTDGDAWVEVPGLGPWETVAIEYLIEGDCSWCWSWVYVDSTNAVAESVESDNAYGPVDVFGKYW